MIIGKLIIEKSLGFLFSKIKFWILSKSLTIFCFHDITDKPSQFSLENGLYIPIDVFEYQIQYINKYFNVINPLDITNTKIPDKAAMITFDDGFKSFFKNAVPVLEKYQTPSIIFLNMGIIRGEIFWPALIIYLCKQVEFRKYLSNKLKYINDKKSLFLSCTKDIVDEYILISNDNIKQNILSYVGEIADEKDLESCSINKLVYYGNHTYSHYVSSLLTDDEFVSEVTTNSNLLSKYPNYTEFFAFPFGQPNTTFRENQINLLMDIGIRKAFCSSSTFNHCISSILLDRVDLLSYHKSPDLIWYKIIKPYFKKRISYVNIKAVPANA